MTAAPAGPTTEAAGPAEGERAPAGFSVELENFSGPFEVLLSLITRRRLDITEVSLAAVTDEFIGYLRRLRARIGDRALDETTQFLVVAATLLDLKAARLLPAGDVESDEDIALLESRDLLFARLLQYRAFKAAAADIAGRLERESTRHPRQAGLEPQFARLLPELVWGTAPEDFARIAERALAPKDPAPAEVGTGHLHAPAVSVREQAGILAARLRGGGAHSFRTLVADADSTLVVVARFLALLEMYRDRVVGLDQAAPLGELLVHWSAADRDWSAGAAVAEYDEPPGDAP